MGVEFSVFLLSDKAVKIIFNILVRNGLPSLSSSNTIQRLLQQQHHHHQPQQITSNMDTNTEQIREKLQPLNTQRLKILRQATKSFIVS